MPYTVKGMSYNEICMPYDVVKAVNNEKKKITKWNKSCTI